ncbi:unnamed protein product [Trifolium pratense]|uniref:Uncharacterized protein n=1 Tax=Trifolium pratense TaxID=57577 RepID=A0ACB0KSR7_TRIPR|nr:unnamed protein product [Trifolium pratense]
MKTLFSSNKSCGNCLKLQPSDVHEPKISIYQNTNPSRLTSSTTNSREDNADKKVFASTTISKADTIYHNDDTLNHSILKSGTKLIDSIAVEKDSHDPYEDFRNSIVQMILEREIYLERDLEELLECFLQLNAKCHQQVIVRAFMEICEEIFPKKFHGDEAS